MSKMIKVLKVEPNKIPYVDTIPDSYDAFKSYLNGYIEYLHLDNNTLIICNEEAKLIGLEPNRYIFDGLDVICGNFLIVGDDGIGGECSLTNRQIKKWSAYFKDTPIIDQDKINIDIRFISF